MGDREIMDKYTLSENQLHKLWHKLVDAGAIDEMELFMRTSLLISALFGLVFPDYFALPVGLSDCFDRVGY